MLTYLSVNSGQLYARLGELFSLYNPFPLQVPLRSSFSTGTPFTRNLREFFIQTTSAFIFNLLLSGYWVLHSLLFLVPEYPVNNRSFSTCTPGRTNTHGRRQRSMDGNGGTSCRQRTCGPPFRTKLGQIFTSHLAAT